MPDDNRPKRHVRFTPNIGTVIFGILFLYIIISGIFYITASHVKSYRVTVGPLAENNTYTGLAVYKEHIYPAETGGYVSYFAAENEKIQNGGAVYGISTSKRQTIKSTVSSKSRSEIQSRVRNFSKSFDPADYHDVYSLNYQIEGVLLNQALSSGDGKATAGDTTINTSPASGIVVYETDGYESFNPSKITSENLDEKNYSQNQLKAGRRVHVGDPIYKLITSEKWSLYIPLSARQVIKLGNLSTVKVKFLKDGVTQNADFSILQPRDGEYYGRLDFDAGVERYLDNRFVDIELVTNREIGLKVPLSSVVSKSFYVIPKKFAIKDQSSGGISFKKTTTSSDGKKTTSYVTPDIYDVSGGKYYVDNQDFQNGDIITMDHSSTSRYIIGDTATLEGVYCMNKGYAEFRKTDIIDKNEEYCIVKQGVSYSLSPFDNIVLDASKVKESQITARKG